MARTLNQIMDEIHRMQQNLTDGQNKNARNRRQPSDNDIREYVQKELDKEKVDPKSAVSKYIADLLARNPKIRKGENGLAKDLPKADEARKEKMRKLRRDAAQSGIKKVFTDLGSRKRSAKKELRSIAQDKLRTEGKKPIADEKTALKEISAGRSRRKWRLMQPLMNRFGLGSYQKRHNPDVSFPKPDNCTCESITAKTPNGTLDGMVYHPNAPKMEDGKVVIFFSGSGIPAGGTCEPAVKKYLDANATVVSMDYRGFGKSKTLNKNGKKTGTPLCEKTIYEDGKEMLKYVIEKMGVKPENIILHGYSMGGAVASKVAADFYQEQQKKALEEGRLLKEQKLGGLVLQSPIESMYDTAKGKVGGLHLAGMLGWSGAGGYNTRSHMQRLHKLDPDLPVHYVSGKKITGDLFDIDATKIDSDPKALFRNSSSHRTLGDHYADNLKSDKDLELLAQQGRNVNFRNPNLLRNGPEVEDEGVIMGGLT